MKQLLLRVPDELHERLSKRARLEGRSVNALATEALDNVPVVEPSARELIRRRAGAAGLLATTGRGRISAPDIAVVRRTFVGIGVTAEQLIDEQRGGPR
jgi:predicted transcriptional regulator